LNYMAETCWNFFSGLKWPGPQIQLQLLLSPALQAPLHTETWNSKLFQICRRPHFVRTTQNLALLVLRDTNKNTWVVWLGLSYWGTNGPTSAWSF
jgi:hypothetical protein